MDLFSYKLGKKAGGGGGDTGDYNAKFGEISTSLDHGLTDVLTKIKKIDFKYTNMSAVFDNFIELTEVETIDCHNIVTNLSGAFYNCKKLTNVNIINTNSLTNVSIMFYNCQSLSVMPIFNTSQVTSTARMFHNCQSLTEALLFDTSNVTDMSTMFSGCTKLEKVPIYNTQSVTNFGSMFSYDLALTDESLYNILEMCINATSYTSTKKLTTLGITNNAIKNRVYQLSNYQDFLNAGWTIN